jgi:hypothetical protein
MFKVLTLNNIAVEGLRHFPRDRYEVASEIAHPDAITRLVVPEPVPITYRSNR